MQWHDKIQNNEQKIFHTVSINKQPEEKNNYGNQSIIVSNEKEINHAKSCISPWNQIF